MDDSKEVPVARSSELLPKPKPQPTLSKTKKLTSAKQKYVDIKRAQLLAKNKRASR